MKRVLLLLLSLCLTVPRPGHAQILGTGVMPVVEVGANLFQNTITAGQSIITAAHMVMSVANEVMELTPMDEIIVAQDIAEDMALLKAILVDAQGLGQDLRTLQALFDVKTLTGQKYSAWLVRIQAMNEAIYTSRSYAMKAQTLITTLLSTVNHLTSLVNHVGALVGNMQGNQTLTQVNTTMSKSLAVLTTQTAGAQRMETLVGMREDVIMEMHRQTAEAYWAPLEAISQTYWEPR